jgi:nuclear GTP-binding protein
MNPDLPHLRSVLDAADVIVQVLDARDPLSYICPSINDYSLSKGKKSLYVLNKIGISRLPNPLISFPADQC